MLKNSRSLIAGGILADTIGWRLGFGIQIPFIFISLFMVAKFINVKQPPVNQAVASGSRLKRIDFGGSISIVAAVSCLILGFNIGGNLVPWLSAIPITLLGTFLVLVGIFIYIEARVAREPIMPMRLMTTVMHIPSSIYTTNMYSVLHCSRH